MFKQITTIVTIYSFLLLSVAKADFYVKSNMDINLLSNKNIVVSLPNLPNSKLSGTLSYSKRKENIFDITINWNILEYKNIEQAIDNLSSQIINDDLIIKTGKSILVSGALPEIPEEQKNEKGQSKSSYGDKNNLPYNALPLKTNNSSSTSSSALTSDTSDIINNENKEDNNIIITTSIDDCKLSYNAEKDTIDIYIKDFYYDNNGKKVVKKPCYFNKTVPAKYQECKILVDYPAKKTYFRRQAIYVDKKNISDVGQIYSASECIPYQTYNNYFAVADTGCTAFIKDSMRLERGKYYYITADGVRHYTTDCIVDPDGKGIKMSINHEGCPLKNNINDNYSIYYGKYYYFDRQNNKVEIGDCQDLGPDSFFKQQISFVKWKHEIEKGYTMAINKRFIMVGNDEVEINKEEEGIQLFHEIKWDGKWVNHDETDVKWTSSNGITTGNNTNIPYSRKEMEQSVFLPKPFGDNKKVVLKTFEGGEKVNHIINKSACSVHISNGWKPEGEEQRGFNLRPDESKYENIRVRWLPGKMNPLGGIDDYTYCK